MPKRGAGGPKVVNFEQLGQTKGKGRRRWEAAAMGAAGMVTGAAG